MVQPTKALITTVLALGLIACGGQDPETLPDATPEATEQQQGLPARSEPADAPPAPIEPADAAASEPADLEQARSERQRLRESRQDHHGWWSDEALADRLGLDTEQRAALLEARETLLEARLDGRTRLQEQRLAGRAAADAQDPERLAELRESRTRIQSEIEAAEQAWQDAVRSILSGEQLEQLRTEQ